MDDKKDVEPQQIMPTYSGFLIDKLNKISETWDNGDQEHALHRTCRLVYFLPTDLKKVLFPKMAIINDKMNKACSLGGMDSFTTQRKRNNAMEKIAVKELPSFLDQLVQLLDQRGYLEKAGRRLKSDDFKKLGENE